MLLICEGIFFVLGIFIMITGKLKLSRNRLIVGNRARLAGFFLFIPGPVMVLIGLYVGSTYANDPTGFRQAIASLTLVEFIAIVTALIVALLVAVTAPSSDTSLATTYELPEILTLSEAALYLRVSESDVRQMIENGRLKAVAIGGDYRISKEALNTVFHS